MNQIPNMNQTSNPFQLPCKNIKPRKRKTNSLCTTPLTPSERLIFFRQDREDLTLAIMENLPDELCYRIMETNSTAESNLIHKINQLHHSPPEGSNLVIRPNSYFPKLLLNPTTPQSQKIWAIENGLCYGLVSHSYKDRVHLFPTLTAASLKLKDLCSDKLYFKFHSTPPTWETVEDYEPAQHIVLVTEYFGWWDSIPTQFLATDDRFYKEGYHPVPTKLSDTHLSIEKARTQMQMQSTMEALPMGFHIFHHSQNWIFLTNVQGILKTLIPKFTGNFIHEPRRWL